MGWADADFEDTAAWAAVLSHTGALMAHIAREPKVQRLVGEMLSLGLAGREAAPGAAAREAAALAAPFSEPLAGLHTRELHSEELFSHFFGAVPAAAAASPAARPR